MGSLFGNTAPAHHAPQAHSVARTLTLPAARGDGMQISSVIYLKDGAITVDLEFENLSPAPLSGFMIQFNKNSLNLKPAERLNVPTLNPGQKAQALLKCRQEEPAGPGSMQSPFLQMAIKNNIKVYYLQDKIPLHATYIAGGQVPRDEFLALWQSIPGEVTQVVNVSGRAEDIKQRFGNALLYFVAQRQDGGNVS